MRDHPPSASIVIPTHNRLTSLQRVLDALCRQTYGPRNFEVLVVADGCTDGTIAWLARYRPPFDLRFMEQAQQGPGGARNRGASLAAARLLVFLDDDLEPTPGLLDAHVDAHKRRQGHVVLGPYPPAGERGGFLLFQVRAWWDDLFHSMRLPGHRFTHANFLSGNFSIEASLFTGTGGFDPSFRVHEDYEFGLRLIKARVPFTFAERARAYHHAEIDLSRSCTRKTLEGQADVQMARRHPEILPAQRWAREWPSHSAPARIVLRLVCSMPVVGRALAWGLRVLLGLVEWMRLRPAWLRIFGALQDMSYWRGAAAEAGGVSALLRAARSAGTGSGDDPSRIDIDLRDGIERAVQQLDSARPMTARIRYGRRLVGVLSPLRGFEPLRGSHLRPALVRDFAAVLLDALALDGAIASPARVNPEALAGSIKRAADWFGPTKPGQMWFEQYAQWKRLRKEQLPQELAVEEQHARLRALRDETAWLEEQRQDWQRLAARQEAALRVRGLWTTECEQRRAGLVASPSSGDARSQRHSGAADGRATWD